MGYICGNYGAQQPTRYAFTSDTLIGGNVYKKVKSYYAYTILMPSPNCPPFLFDTIAITLNDYFYRDDTLAQQVLRYSSSTNLIDTVFDFSLNKGDTLHYVSPLVDFIVDTVFYITTNDGISRKVLASNFCIFPDLFASCIVEGIGSQRGFVIGPTPAFFEDGPWLMCVKDSLNNNITGNDCYGFVTGLKQDNKPIDFLFYPNPNSGTLYFSSTININKISIYSLSGEMVLQQFIGKDVGSLQISKKLMGLYMIEAFDIKNHLVKSRLLQFH